MSRRSAGTGTTFSDALREAIAGLVDVDTEDVIAKIDAKGLDDLLGPVVLELDVHPVAGDQDQPAAPAPAPRAVPRDEPSSADERDEVDEPLTQEDLDEEADAAADFLEGLLDAMDLPGDIRIRTTDDHAEVEVVEIGSGALIGRRGQTLEAIQELVRCALQREFQRRSRVKVDAEGYRSRRLEKLIEKAEEAIDDVLDTGEPVRLEPMDVFERKAVHNIVSETEGVLSRSQGREPARRVVIERD